MGWARDYFTLKFLNRLNPRELSICQFIRDHCRSPSIVQIEDHFTIPHHLAEVDENYAGIEFNVIVYRPTGTDFRRASEERTTHTFLSPRSLRKYAVDIVNGVADMHKNGLVHGGE